jgi:hypothetical protein
VLAVVVEVQTTAEVQMEATLYFYLLLLLEAVEVALLEQGLVLMAVQVVALHLMIQGL